MYGKKNSKEEDSMNISNFCLFKDADDKKDDDNLSSDKKLPFNKKASKLKKRNIFKDDLNKIQNIDNENENKEINFNDTFHNFKLLDSNRDNNFINNFNNNDYENINNNDNQENKDEFNNNINNNINFNINNNNINEDLNINNQFFQNNDDNNNNNNINKNIINNIININNNFNNNILNINNNNNENKKMFNDNNSDNDSNLINENDIIDFNKYKMNINNSASEDEKEENKINNINDNKIKKFKINDNNIINQEIKKPLNFNKNIKIDLRNNLGDKNVLDKLKKNMDLKNKNKSINKSNKTFVFSSKKNYFENKEIEEEKRKKEMIEKERSNIRDKLKCYLCFGKIAKARLCLNCKKMACEECVKNMISKHGKCLNCQKPSSLNDIVLLPFLDDLTHYFINIENQQKNENQRNYIIDEDDEEDQKYSNNIRYNNIKNIKKEEKIQPKCGKHNKILEYYCLQCKEQLCDKCLLFFNQSSVERHNQHTIIPLTDLKKYGIKEALDEYNKLSDTKNELDKIYSESKLKMRKLAIKKESILKNLNEAKKNLEEKYIEEMSRLEELSNSILAKQEKIENSIDSVPNSFNNIINKKDYVQGYQILQELKKLNHELIPKNDIKNKNSGFKDNLYFESYESNEVNIILPENGAYKEELKICDNKINLIPEQESKIKIELLGGNLIFTLSIKIEPEYYNKYHPLFKGYFMLINNENKIEYTSFIGNIYVGGEQILSTEFAYEDIKNVIGGNNNFKIICCVDKICYK